MTETLLESRIKELTFQENTPYVTIALPLNYDNFEDPYLVLQDLIKKVKSELQNLTNEVGLKSINKKLNKLQVKLPPPNSFKSLVAFISEDFEEIFPLSIQVDKKAVVSDNFDFKDILEIKANKISVENEEIEAEELKEVIRKRYIDFQPFGKKTY